MKFSIETFGCRMNICDSEIIVTILRDAGHDYVQESSIADVVILNSCSVREDGHNAIRKRLASLSKDAKRRKILVLAGCYASLLDDSAFSLFPTVDIIVNSIITRHYLHCLIESQQGKDTLLIFVEIMRRYMMIVSQQES